MKLKWQCVGNLGGLERGVGDDMIKIHLSMYEILK